MRDKVVKATRTGCSKAASSISVWAELGNMTELNLVASIASAAREKEGEGGRITTTCHGQEWRASIKTYDTMMKPKTDLAMMSRKV